MTQLTLTGSVAESSLPRELQYGLRNYTLVVAKQLTWRGFINRGSGPEADTFYDEFPHRIKSGEIKVREHVVRGLDDGQAFVDLLSGKSQGKVVIELE